MPSSRQVGMTLGFRIARPHRVLRLYRGDRMHRVSAPDCLRRGFAEPQVANLAGLDQLRHRSDSFFNRDVGVNAMLVVEVDVIRAEALQRSVDRASDMRSRAVQRSDRREITRLGGRLEATREFGGDDVLVAVAFDCTADERLVGHRSVELRRIEEVDAEFQRTVNGRDGLVVVARAVEGRHPHAAEPQRRDLERSQLASLHRVRSGMPATLPTGLESTAHARRALNSTRPRVSYRCRWATMAHSRSRRRRSQVVRHGSAKP